MMKRFLLSAAISLVTLASANAGFCDTCATSRRDCNLCKIGYNDETDYPNESDRESACKSAKGPCFWNTVDDASFLDNFSSGTCTRTNARILSPSCSGGVVNTPPPAPGVCNNDGTCDTSGGETCASCPGDCTCNCDGICGTGEDCTNCPDCAGKQNGRPSDRYCCNGIGGSVGEGPVDCNDTEGRCGNCPAP